MILKRFSILITILITSISCSNDSTENNIVFEIMESGSLSYSEEDKIARQFIVIKDQDEWLKLIDKIEAINPGFKNNLANKEYDFSSKRIVFIIGQYQYYCCSEISVNSVFEKQGEIMVDFEESKAGMATAISQAYQIISISKN